LNNFYIYIYLDPRKFGKYSYKNLGFLYEPFYVGKGKNNRWKSNCGRNRHFKRIINKIKNSGLEPIVFKLYENLNEKDSLKKEIELIEEIGCKFLRTGTLINETTGGDGISGYKHTEESIKLSSKKRRKNFSDIKQEFEKRNYVLLTQEKEYRNAFTKLNYVCPKGHNDYISWSKFKQRHNCFNCWKGLLSKKKKGENNLNSILTEEQVIQIKLLLKEGILTQQEIADMFGVKQTTISAIKNKRSWSHIKI